MNLHAKQKQELQLQKTNLWLPGGKKGRGINWEVGINIHTAMYKTGGFLTSK